MMVNDAAVILVSMLAQVFWEVVTKVRLDRQESYSVKNLWRMQGREQELGERASDCDARLKPVMDGGGRGTG